MSRRSPEEQAAWEQQAYGCLGGEFLKSVDNSLTVRMAKTDDPLLKQSLEEQDKSGGYGMVVMSILSDAQEMVAHGDLNGARQYMNRAKLVVSRRWMKSGA